jgi:hypothetical protein
MKRIEGREGLNVRRWEELKKGRGDERKVRG